MTLDANSGAEQLLDTIRRKELRLDELVDHSARLIPMFVGKQVRYKVSDLPDKRTIRYYVQKGLIDRPVRAGRNAMFSYRHLLQVLVIKRLQSDYIPLRRIEEVTRASTEEELERLLTFGGSRFNAPVPIKTPSPSAGLAMPVPPLKPDPGYSCKPESGYSWRPCHKFRINEHLELHVDDGFHLVNPSVDLDIINARITNALSLFSLDSIDWSAYDAASPLILDQPDRLCFLPAPPVASLTEATVALITEGGLVPKGNPDRLESAHATRFLKYSLSGMGDLEPGAFESIDKGWDTTHVNADPDRLLPFDVMCDLEANRTIGKVHRYFYTTTGVATTVDAARKIGRDIAAELKLEGVSAAILTAT
jgi:DNA-binding transcriptional MerR regulator